MRLGLAANYLLENKTRDRKHLSVSIVHISQIPEISRNGEIPWLRFRVGDDSRLFPHDFNLQRALAGVPIENQRDRKEPLFTEITLLANAAGIMNNSKVFLLFQQPPTELINGQIKDPEMSGLCYWLTSADRPNAFAFGLYVGIHTLNATPI